MKFNILNIALAALLPVSCGPKEEPKPVLQPAVSVNVKSTGAREAFFEIKIINASDCATLCLSASESAPADGNAVFFRGSVCKPGNITVSDLKPGTDYVLYAAARNNGQYSKVVSRSFSTEKLAEDLYWWEENRSSRVQRKPGPGDSGRFADRYDNMCLLYGGNMRRAHQYWDETRVSSHVTWSDENGKEQWLFDAFLIMEINECPIGGPAKSLAFGYGNDSGDKASWSDFLDYWFNEPGKGLNALDKAVGDAARRIGNPPVTRKVVVSMPEPIIHLKATDAKSSTAYWGSLNGRKLDFKNATDRIDAVKWFIDEVRSRWNKAGFSNLELYGFYIFTEELHISGDAWEYELKRHDDVFPKVVEYLHSINESVSWIPYNNARGYKYWSSVFDIDIAMMQPNYLWHGEYSIADYQSRRKQYNLSMEIEFDDTALASNTDTAPRTRFLQYFDMARNAGLYGTAPLSYYLGEDDFNSLKNSLSAKDKELYNTFCKFITGHSQH